MIPQTAMDKLLCAGRDISNSQFIIGDVTLDLIAELNYARQHIVTRVGEITGLSGRRVDKIAYVCAAFPDMTRNPHYGFGYYEQAYNLGDDKYDAIQFLDFFEQEYGRVLSVSEFTLVFRQHILGEKTYNEPPEEVREHGLYIQRLKFLARSRQNGDAILRLLDEVETAFASYSPSLPEKSGSDFSIATDKLDIQSEITHHR